MIAQDAVGDADGQLVDATLTESGRLKLEGDTAHVQLPSGIISALRNATFEAWVLWDGGETNQRLFNFGSLPNPGAAPDSYLSLTPSSNDGSLSASLRTGPGSGRSLSTDVHFPTGVTQHVALVVNAEDGELLLYLDGELIASAETPHRLTQLKDEANFLGRPLYADYPHFRGELDEFRIYDEALSSERIQASGELGPDIVF